MIWVTKNKGRGHIHTEDNWGFPLWAC